MNRRATTLTETLMAIFLLLAGMLIVINLLHASLRHQARIEKRALSVQLAQLTLDRVRAWAWEKTAGTCNFHSNWAFYNGVTLTDPAYPGLTVQVDVSPGGRSLFSPASTLEQTYSGLPRRMTRAVVPVRVRVSQSGSDSVTLLTYVGEPPLELAPLTITGAAGALAQDASVTLQVSATDLAGNPVQGLSYFWSVEPTGPNPGLGTLVTDLDADGLPDRPRDGSQIDFQHRYLRSDGTAWRHKDGQCRVIARTRQYGRTVTGEVVLDLSPGPLP
ncbi:hypothetical protein DYH09_20910 [bacterium CPR1]|nr:hypothetical protein [bacterium CPR1]